MLKLARGASFLRPILLCLLAAGCDRQTSIQLDHQMGEKVTLGPLTYTVVETAWRSQL